jgi:N-sulfoglucosamine sulfohydrolase
MKQLLLAFNVLAFIYSTALAETTITASKPNFVVFIADDHSMLDSAAYGAAEIRTPNMQRLAESGMKFTHAFVASPSCGPSRTALLTGLWSARNGAEPNHKPKRADVASLPPVLHALGYEVAAIGKVAHNVFAKDHGFDFIEATSKGISETKAVADFLDQRKTAKPLCLFVGTRHPHTPWTSPSAYAPEKIALPPTHVDTPETREMRARYLTDVTKADVLLGEVHAMVREKIRGDTLFIYTADHGGAWPFSKWTLYDEGIRVPLIVEWPGHLKPGSLNDAMVCWPDLLPTFIELAGGEVPAGLDGKSFAGLLHGTAKTHRERVFSTHSGDGDFNVYPIRSVRTRDWKYIRNLHPEFQQHTHISRSEGPSGREYWMSWLDAASKDPNAAAIVNRYIQHPAEELYDLVADPFELNNLAIDPMQSDRLDALRHELNVWMREQGDQQTVFGKPLLIGEPVTTIAPGGKAGKRK